MSNNANLISTFSSDDGQSCRNVQQVLYQIGSLSVAYLQPVSLIVTTSLKVHTFKAKLILKLWCLKTFCVKKGGTQTGWHIVVLMVCEISAHKLSMELKTVLDSEFFGMGGHSEISRNGR